MHTLTNDSLRVDVEPRRGARIESFFDTQTKKDWVWHPKNYHGKACSDVELGSSFDHNWEGGWEDIFPNDAPTKFVDKNLADHGELWSQPWETISQNSHQISLFLAAKTVPIHLHKTIHLCQKKNELILSYHLENISKNEVPFHFKFHPALPIEANDELVMPSCELTPVDLGFSSLAKAQRPTPYPYVYSDRNEFLAINKFPNPNAKIQEFVYCRNLSAGFCGLRNQSTHSEIKFHFELSQFPYVWIFQSLGSFFDHQVLMLEPSTSDHYDLNINFSQSHCPVLKPRQSSELKISVSLTRF